MEILVQKIIFAGMLFSLLSLTILAGVSRHEKKLLIGKHRNCLIWKMMLTAALVAALSLSAVPDVLPASAGSGHSTSAKMTVTATVPPRASIRILHQTPELVVTNADISRGYVEVTAASRIEVRNNSQAGYLLAFEGLAAPFREVYVQGLGNEVQISSGIGMIHQQYTKGTVTTELSYRFILAENAEPGTYAWPLAISAQPL